MRLRGVDVRALIAFLVGTVLLGLFATSASAAEVDWGEPSFEYDGREFDYDKSANNTPSIADGDVGAGADARRAGAQSSVDYGQSSDHFAPSTAPGVSGIPRTGSALKTDLHHAFPDLVDNFSGSGQVFSIPTKGPGGVVVRQSDLHQVTGSLNGGDGVFEWIVDVDEITHRRFIPGGTVTGFPNQVPPP